MFLKRHENDDIPKCSFCHKNQDEVDALISNPGDISQAFICNECVAACNSVLREHRKSKAASAASNAS